MPTFHLDETDFLSYSLHQHCHRSDHLKTTPLLSFPGMVVLPLPSPYSTHHLQNKCMHPLLLLHQNFVLLFRFLPFQHTTTHPILSYLEQILRSHFTDEETLCLKFAQCHTVESKFSYLPLPNQATPSKIPRETFTEMPRSGFQPHHL